MAHEAQTSWWGSHLGQTVPADRVGLLHASVTTPIFRTYRTLSGPDISTLGDKSCFYDRGISIKE